ncbi:juvenile hormone acid O-methyltransferase-like [Uloborus diversus]|uniref:juvenile hormone acid O-methyltransferase-like n=1 Tax=Uloborus diversus TaxID=327109 RepID=UPI002409E984|nr:juvenile hormone acid O-methyltransferase-like [Uloborus diversus]XP_054707614.1 juvenile hormone acid O-methyltransferase-like [Uloborus diversus]XP_054723485.1 juvenile hormone acid O-methyltransferase-like [Uloborus diversus]
MLSDASLYSKHRSMQICDTETFIDSLLPKMRWGRCEQEIVMDVGCGPGNSINHLFLPKLPKANKVVAIDVLPDMIEFAKKNNAHPKIEYFQANVEDRSTLLQWENGITKIISIYCFNWLKDHKKAFENIFYVLKPGGEAALLFVLATPFWDSYKEHVENPKWNKYLEGVEQHIPESHFTKYDASHYKKMLENIGFKVKVCEDEMRIHTYPNEEDCKVAAMSRCALTQHIPESMRAEFKEDLFRGFMKYNSRNSEGKPVLRYTTLTLLIEKPEEKESSF